MTITLGSVRFENEKDGAILIKVNGDSGRGHIHKLVTPILGHGHYVYSPPMGFARFLSAPQLQAIAQKLDELNKTP